MRPRAVQKGAVLVVHYYVGSLLQDLADETGGCVSGSLQMTGFGATQPGFIESYDQKS